MPALMSRPIKPIPPVPTPLSGMPDRAENRDRCRIPFPLFRGSFFFHPRAALCDLLYPRVTLCCRAASSSLGVLGALGGQVCRFFCRSPRLPSVISCTLVWLCVAAPFLLTTLNHQYTNHEPRNYRPEFTQKHPEFTQSAHQFQLISPRSANF